MQAITCTCASLKGSDRIGWYHAAVMHAAAGRRRAGTFSHAATPIPLKSAWRENLKNLGLYFTSTTSVATYY